MITNLQDPLLSWLSGSCNSSSCFFFFLLVHWDGFPSTAILEVFLKGREVCSFPNKYTKTETRVNDHQFNLAYVSPTRAQVFLESTALFHCLLETNDIQDSYGNLMRWPHHNILKSTFKRMLWCPHLVLPFSSWFVVIFRWNNVHHSELSLRHSQYNKLMMNGHKNPLQNKEWTNEKCLSCYRKEQEAGRMFLSSRVSLGRGPAMGVRRRLLLIQCHCTVAQRGDPSFHTGFICNTHRDTC